MRTADRRQPVPTLGCALWQWPRAVSRPVGFNRGQEWTNLRQFPVGRSLSHNGTYGSRKIWTDWWYTGKWEGEFVCRQQRGFGYSGNACRSPLGLQSTSSAKLSSWLGMQKPPSWEESWLKNTDVEATGVELQGDNVDKMLRLESWDILAFSHLPGEKLFFQRSKVTVDMVVHCTSLSLGDYWAPHTVSDSCHSRPSQSPLAASAWLSSSLFSTWGHRSCIKAPSLGSARQWSCPRCFSRGDLTAFLGKSTLRRNAHNSEFQPL